MSTITINVALIVEIASAIVVLGSAVAVVRKVIRPMTKPIEDLRDKVEQHSECLDKDNKRIGKMEASLDEIIADNRMMMKALLTLLHHGATGNSTGELRATKKDLEEYLINK